MSFENNIKEIKKLAAIVTGKDSDVNLTYKGTSHGVSKPWHLVCNTREINSVSHEEAAEELVKILRKELLDKISSLERLAAEHRKVLGSLEN